MQAGELMIIEMATIQEGKAGEAREAQLHSVELIGQMPGVHHAWAIQDQANPCEQAIILVVDAARWPDIQREIDEAEWHKELVPRVLPLIVRERVRRVIGPAVR